MKGICLHTYATGTKIATPIYNSSTILVDWGGDRKEEINVEDLLQWYNENRPAFPCKIGDWFYTVTFSIFEKKWTINRSMINRIAFDADRVFVSNDSVEYYTLGEDAFLNIKECEKYMIEYERKFVDVKLI
jgi:hypothetical protein